MLQQGVPRRALVLEAQKALNCFSCSPEPQSFVYPLFIASPYPRPAPPPSSRDQKALLAFVSPVTQNRVGSAVGWTRSVFGLLAKACFHPSGAPGSEVASALRATREANERTAAALLDIGARSLSLLRASVLRLPLPRACHAAPFCPGETGASSARGWARSRRAVTEADCEARGPAECVGLLHNGQFLLASVVAFGHGKVVRACIS